MPTLAVTDVKRRGADEPVGEAQRLWLRNLVDVLGYLESDRPDMQYPDKNLMREVAHATRETVAPARRIVRYVVRNTHLVWTFHVERRHSSSTHSLTEIGPRTKRDGGQAWKLFLDTARAMERRCTLVSRSSSVWHPTAICLQRSVAWCRPEYTQTRTLHEV